MNDKLSARAGVDIVEITRIKKAIEKSGKNFIERVYTPKEQEHCLTRPNPYPSYAARFAAKESVMKILGEGVWSIPFTDIEITGGGDSRPSVKLHRKAQIAADKLGVTSLDISLSHEKEYAIATAFGLIYDSGS